MLETETLERGSFFRKIFNFLVYYTFLRLKYHLFYEDSFFVYTFCIVHGFVVHLCIVDGKNYDFNLLC